ncbi:MAG: dihydroorotate dehydrogenase electron transfer subunit, partial [Chloroflexota bacterium]|nr:dihydroorotate dehydrogenase electron transfer subunit [Chloroflexota bacterium]
VTDALERACADWRPEAIYACGPMGMVLAVAAFARAKKLPAQLSFEALIRCGIGLCGSCELPESTCLELGIPSGFLVCHDGPVVKC